MPSLTDTSEEIFCMKEAVDRQELKIQTSLVNEEDVLGNIANRTLIRNKNEKNMKNDKNVKYQLEAIRE